MVVWDMFVCNVCWCVYDRVMRERDKEWIWLFSSYQDPLYCTCLLSMGLFRVPGRQFQGFLMTFWGSLIRLNVVLGARMKFFRSLLEPHYNRFFFFFFHYACLVSQADGFSGFQGLFIYLSWGFFGLEWDVKGPNCKDA